MLKFIPLALVSILSTQPVLAQSSPNDHLQLLRTVNRVGVSVQIDAPICAKEIYGAYFQDGSALVLCSKGDQAERLDTIRHEAWHMLQDFKDCNLPDYGLNLILPSAMVPEEVVEAVKQHYPAEAVSFEAEAFFAAAVFDAQEINELIVRQASECGIAL